MATIETFFVGSGDFIQACLDRDGSWMDQMMQGAGNQWADLTLEEMEDAANDLEGWYWWACEPGCLPDSEASGPFETEEEAREDAKDDEEVEKDRIRKGNHIIRSWITAWYNPVKPEHRVAVDTFLDWVQNEVDNL